jgi:hypothetical protein
MRPQVDVLAAILEERSGARLEQFFGAYGPAEAAAMCFLLATQPPAAVPPVRALSACFTFLDASDREFSGLQSQPVWSTLRLGTGLSPLAGSDLL